MKVKTDYVPEEIDYLTVGKVYEARDQSSNINYIVDDYGDRILIAIRRCPHLCGKNWVIVEK